MAKYGVLLALPNGNPFVTPDSTPLTLYKKVSFNSNYNGGFNSAVIEEKLSIKRQGLYSQEQVLRQKYQL